MVLNSGRGNRLLAVTDDAEGVAVMGRTTPLIKGGVSQNLANRVRSVRVWVTRREPRSHVEGCRGALATAPLAPATPGHISDDSDSVDFDPFPGLVCLQVSDAWIERAHRPQDDFLVSQERR